MKIPVPKLPRMKLSIQKKIILITIIAAIPFLGISVYLLGSILNYSKAYEGIVSNMTIANNYNLNFKEEMDESLYKLVVGYADFENISSDKSIKDPYRLIDELRDEFQTLSEVTTQTESKMWLESLLRNIDSLERNVKDIEKSVKMEGQYQQNIEKLDNNVYILTELIQDDIQYYIYYQTKDMERVNKILKEQINRFFRVAIAVVIGMSILVTMLAVFLTNGALRPMRELSHATGQIAQGNFEARASVDTGDEFEILATEFNDMARNMQSMIDQIKADERKMRQADLRLLQEQINPHFLYNTLDTIVWLVEANQPQQAVDMIVTLSNFFRLVLSKGKEYITIQEEQRHVQSYLDIQKVRYHDILEYEINIDQVLYEYSILKMTLQPLVENALYHGIKYKRAKGRIYITGELDNGEVILTVQDNGVGMEAGDLVALREQIDRPCQETEKGFGLANVNERIKMYYGMQYGLSITSEKGKGTKVTVTIPAIKNDRNTKAGETEKSTA